MQKTANLFYAGLILSGLAVCFSPFQIAVAGEATPAPVERTLHLSDQEIIYIAQVLQRQPYADVTGLLNKMQEQMTAQLKADDAAKAKGKTDEKK